MDIFKLTPSRVTEIALDARRADRGEVSSYSTDAAANAFLGTLNTEQRAQAMYALDDPLRPNWSNLPAGILDFERNGIRLGELNDDQVGSAFDFLSVALSKEGYRKVVDVVGADEVLSHSERAGHFAWTDENYWLAFFGEPSITEKWGWQFGGHHLGVNVTLADGKHYFSPTFIGVEPASYIAGDRTIAPLAAELQAGIALVNSLSEDQRSRALVTDRPVEVWAGAQQDGFLPELEGSRVVDWSGEQKDILLKTIAMWTSLVDEASGTEKLSEIEADLDEIYFAWHGPFDDSGPIYYRIQGPRLLIEYSTQGGVGADTGHYHTIYRDPTNEYGVNAGIR